MAVRNTDSSTSAKNVQRKPASKSESKHVANKSKKSKLDPVTIKFLVTLSVTLVFGWIVKYFANDGIQAMMGSTFISILGLASFVIFVISLLATLALFVKVAFGTAKDMRDN